MSQEQEVDDRKWLATYLGARGAGETGSTGGTKRSLEEEMEDMFY